MTRPSSFSLHLLALAAASLIAGGCSSTTIVNDGDGTSSADDAGSSSGSGSGNNSGSGSSGDGWEPCSDSNPCPSGQFCFNGLCALGCTSDDDCASNQYCDTFLMLCQNKEVPTCTEDADCASGQVCLDGLCSTPPEDTSCNPDGVITGQDGCDSNAICLADFDDSTACWTLPACAEDGTCPVGTVGAVCNNDYIPKDHICLIGMCEGDANCPSDWNCFRYGNEVLGTCSSGQSGSPCNNGADCVSGVCTEFIPGAPGFCE